MAQAVVIEVPRSNDPLIQVTFYTLKHWRLCQSSAATFAARFAAACFSDRTLHQTIDYKSQYQQLEFYRLDLATML